MAPDVVADFAAHPPRAAADMDRIHLVERFDER
jgi:hypothetical protein